MTRSKSAKRLNRSKHSSRKWLALTSTVRKRLAKNWSTGSVYIWMKTDGNRVLNRSGLFKTIHSNVYGRKWCSGFKQRTVQNAIFSTCAAILLRIFYKSNSHIYGTRNRSGYSDIRGQTGQTIWSQKELCRYTPSSCRSFFEIAQRPVVLIRGHLVRTHIFTCGTRPALRRNTVKLPSSRISIIEHIEGWHGKDDSHPRNSINASMRITKMMFHWWRLSRNVKNIRSPSIIKEVRMIHRSRRGIESKNRLKAMWDRRRSKSVSEPVLKKCIWRLSEAVRIGVKTNIWTQTDQAGQHTEAEKLSSHGHAP